MNKYCACGCGQLITRKPRPDRPNLYIHGHNKTNLGNIMTEAQKIKISLSNKGKHSGINAANWTGDLVGYSGVHEWVRRWLGKPNLCFDCGTKTAKKFEWANISGEYKRDLKDWKRLCVPCHRRMDGHGFKAWATRRAKQLK